MAWHGTVAMSDAIASLASRKRLRVAGLMSGTSVDGVDVAVVDVHRSGVRLLAFGTMPYRPALRAEILRLCRPETARLDRICHYNHVLGHVFADAVIRVCRRHGVPLRSLDLIGSPLLIPALEKAVAAETDSLYLKGFRAHLHRQRQKAVSSEDR